MKLRTQEEARRVFFPHGACLVMTTAVDALKNVAGAFYGLCNAYLTKPIQKAIMMRELQGLNQIP